MKKILGLVLVVFIATCAFCRFNLGETGAIRFLSKMESLMSEGDVATVCAMFSDELEFTISDHSGDAPRQVSGGKKEFCDLTRVSVTSLQVLPHSMNVEYTAVNAHQKLTRPWSSEVSYSEHRMLTIPGANVTLRTISNDQITLVQTLSGVKLLKVKSEFYREEAT